MSKTLRERFEKKYIPEPNSGCWLWTAGIDTNGYGIFWMGDHFDRAHRIAYEFENGKITKGLDLCHRCDTPPCCNPSHMFTGTAKDNLQDMSKKGRWNNQFTENKSCAKGHEYNSVNTYFVGGHRRCRPCRNEAQKRYTKNLKEKCNA